MLTRKLTSVTIQGTITQVDPCYACSKQRAKTQMTCKKSGLKSYRPRAGPIETEGCLVKVIEQKGPKVSNIRVFSSKSSDSLKCNV